MGLNANIYRSTYDSTCNRFHGVTTVCVVNVDGPFDPTDDRPAALLTRGPGGNVTLVPAIRDIHGQWQELARTDHVGPMMGGTYAGCTDSRWSRAVGGYHAVPVLDRYETWDQYRRMTAGD